MKDLRQLLEHYPDNTQILLGNSSGCLLTQLDRDYIALEPMPELYDEDPWDPSYQDEIYL